MSNCGDSIDNALRESGDTSLISWNQAVSVLVSPSANCARSFSQCVPNAHEQPMDGPFSRRAANPFFPLDPLLEETPSLQAPTNFDLCPKHPPSVRL